MGSLPASCAAQYRSGCSCRGARSVQQGRRSPMRRRCGHRMIRAVIRVHSTNHGPARRNEACGRRERHCCRVGIRVSDCRARCAGRCGPRSTRRTTCGRSRPRELRRSASTGCRCAAVPPRRGDPRRGADARRPRPSAGVHQRRRRAARRVRCYAGCWSGCGSRPFRMGSGRRSGTGRPRRPITRGRSSRRRSRMSSRTRSRRPTPAPTCSTVDGGSWTIGPRRWRHGKVFTYLQLLTYSRAIVSPQPVPRSQPDVSGPKAPSVDRSGSWAMGAVNVLQRQIPRIRSSRGRAARRSTA